MARTKYITSTIQRDIGSLGYIEGLRLLHKNRPVLDYFGGIPYALPPVGPYRFHRPRALAPCYRYGHKGNPGRFAGRTGVCPQPGYRAKFGESEFDEDCTQLNIYMPAGEAPKEGWPVFFYIHGGFLQFGTANETPEGIAPLLSETAFKCICVFPAYRLNAFGFLAGNELAEEAKRLNEPVGNYGFWDQRLALEWTWKNISLFGGNSSNITVGGYSAGAHSAFHQLAHELYFVPDHKAIIKRVVMWSNSPGVQPKSIDEHAKQFDELTRALGISVGPDKLDRLRNMSAEQLLSAQHGMKISEFRALSDGLFVSKSLIKDINSGDFARRMKRRGIRLMNGENRDEHHVYRSWRTPSNSYDAVLQRLMADFPESTAQKLMQHYAPSRTLPPGTKDWSYLFGIIYADMQVHGLERGFLDTLSQNGLRAGTDVLRYRFNKRVRCMDSVFPPEWGVTHATDMGIWFWGLDYGQGLTDLEKEQLKSWNEAFAAFVKGESVHWGTSSIKDMRRWTEEGSTDAWQDDQWSKGIELWHLVNGERSTDAKAKL